jgi:hypothetical protein
MNTPGCIVLAPASSTSLAVQRLGGWTKSLTSTRNKTFGDGVILYVLLWSKLVTHTAYVE